jgi:tetrapyrrole methylase family protein/MazG family protein
MFELVEAIEADDTHDIADELGDVLFQIFFIAALYQASGRFSLETVLERNLQKMIRRHPHVFGSEEAQDPSEVRERWRQIKKQERGEGQHSILDSVPSGLPALMRAFRISERAAGIGFEWDDLDGVMAQVESEWAEFRAEMTPPESVDSNRCNMVMEFGDLLFSMVNVARLAKIHPETALSRSTRKFMLRFKQMESMARDKDQALEDLPREEMENLWQVAKGREKRGS